MENDCFWPIAAMLAEAALGPKRSSLAKSTADTDT